MTKRNDGAFQRNARDFYPTPPEAVLPLIFHLNEVQAFAEPCAGDGSLVRALEAHGFRCAFQSDLHGGKDALKLGVHDLQGADCIITNPPYARPLMHALISHLSTLAPTWLLLELDWFATVQSIPYVKLCGDIVPIGRIKWMPDSPSVGFDNYVWASFSLYNTVTRFHPREVAL